MYLKRPGGTNSGKQRWNTSFGVDENGRRDLRGTSDYRGRHCTVKKSKGSDGQRSRRSHTNTFFEISNKNISHSTRKPSRFLTRNQKQLTISNEISRFIKSRRDGKFRRSDTIWDIAEAHSSKKFWPQRSKNDHPRSSNDRKKLECTTSKSTHLRPNVDSVASNLPSDSRTPSKVKRITVHKRNVSPEPRTRLNKIRSDNTVPLSRRPNTTVSHKGLETVDKVQKIYRAKSPSSIQRLKISNGTSRSCHEHHVKSIRRCPKKSSIDIKQSQTKKQKVIDRQQEHGQNYKCATIRGLGSNSRSKTKSETKHSSNSSSGVGLSKSTRPRIDSNSRPRKIDAKIDNGVGLSKSTRPRIDSNSISRKKDAKIDNGRVTKNGSSESRRKSTHSLGSSAMSSRRESKILPNSKVKRTGSKLVPTVNSEKKKKLESEPKAANHYSPTLIGENRRSTQRCSHENKESNSEVVNALTQPNKYDHSCVSTTRKWARGTEIFQQAGLSRKLCGEQLFDRVVQHVLTRQNVGTLSDQENQSQCTCIEKMMEAPGLHYRKAEQTNMLINLGLGSAFRPLSCQREMTIRRQLLKLPGLASSFHFQEWIPVANPQVKHGQQMKKLLEQALYNLI